jgi:hypothetical protein
MTTTGRLPAPAPTVIDREVVGPPAGNPRTVALRITAIGLIATMLGSGYSVHHDPTHLHLVTSADLAAIGLFLLNLWRHRLHDERTGQ